MRRLIEKGLMFGNLIPVTSPVLVERYNRTLRHLTGKQTALEDFHIDISGFAPEVAAELDDPLYLNQHGVNRQFILLTTEQKTAPLLEARFSTSRTILRQFIETNEAALFALTARDAVAGELVNSVYRIDSPADLFDIRRIRIEADTTSGTVATAQRLGGLIDRFKTEPEGWFDDVLIAQMVELAGQTGDLTRNPVELREMEFEQRNFWTAHFGGLYVFREVEYPAMICMEGWIDPENVPVPSVFRQTERSRIATFLEANGLVEPIVKARGIDAAAILRQKMDFMIAGLAAEMGEPLRSGDRLDLRRIARRHVARLPREYHALADLLRWAEEGGPWPRIDSDHPAYFYTLRAADHADADIVNMLLSELAPMDVRQLFICHKQAFYTAYSTWPDEKRAYVAEFLASDYLLDKAGTRAALFGHEAAMQEPQQAPRDMIDLVGPWGAVRRG